MLAISFETNSKMTSTPLWKPPLDFIKETNITLFQNYINQKYKLNHSDYKELHSWSVKFPDQFWSSLIEFTKITIHSNLIIYQV